MTIEEKRQAVKQYCHNREICVDCKLSHINHCTADDDASIERFYNILTYGTADVTRNIAEVSDTFICEKCGIHLEDCVRAEYDEDAEDTTHYEYKFKFCPECGRKIVEE